MSRARVAGARRCDRVDADTTLGGKPSKKHEENLKLENESKFAARYHAGSGSLVLWPRWR